MIVLNETKHSRGDGDVGWLSFVKQGHELAEGDHAHPWKCSVVVPADTDKVWCWLVLEEELKELKIACVGSDLGTRLFIELDEVYVEVVQLVGVSEEDVTNEFNGGFVADMSFADVVT